MKIGTRVRVLKNDYDEIGEDSRFEGLEGTIVDQVRTHPAISNLFIVALDGKPNKVDIGWALYETELEVV